jgi:MATE family multidrug resistance protein
MLASLNWTLLHLIDVAVVGRVSTHELGALAAGRAPTYVVIVVGVSLLSGILVFTARADGAGDHRRVGGVFREGLILAGLLGLFCFSLLLFWTEDLVRGVGVAPGLVDGGSRVVRAMALAFPPQFILCAAAYSLEGVSQPRRPMVVNLTMLPINAVLAWAWAGGHWGFPAEGAAGAALATAVTSFFGAIAMVISVWTLPRAVEFGVRDMSFAAWRHASRGIGGLFRFGVVPGVASGLELLGFGWLIVLSTQLGEVSAAAFQIVFSLHNFAFAFALGFGSAAGVRVGNAVGARELHTVLQRTLIAAALAVLALGLVGMIYVIGADHILWPFSTDMRALTLAAAMLVVWAPFILFDGVQMVFVYALRSLGHQVAAGVNGIFAFFLVTGGLGWLLVRHWHVGPMGLAYASAGGMVAAAILQGASLIFFSSRLRLQSSGASASLPQERLP